MKRNCLELTEKKALTTITNIKTTLITHRGQDAIGQKDPGLKLTRSTHCSQLKPQQHITYTKLAFKFTSKDKRLL